MVHDGAIPRLRIGDEWTADLFFELSWPMERASSTDGLRFDKASIDPKDDGPGPWYQVTARVLRTRSESGIEEVALATPELVLCVRPRELVPEGAAATGLGVLTVDAWQPSWGFPESSRRCRVKRILAWTTARVAGEAEKPRPIVEEIEQFGDEEIPLDLSKLRRESVSAPLHEGVFLVNPKAKVDTDYLVDVDFY
jgi:hypothetical protein